MPVTKTVSFSEFTTRIQCLPSVIEVTVTKDQFARLAREADQLGLDVGQKHGAAGRLAVFGVTVREATRADGLAGPVRTSAA